MGLKIAPSEVARSLQDIENANQQAQAALRRVQQTQEEMLQANWQGRSAGKYSHSTGGQNDEVEAIITNLNNAVSLARGAVNDMQAGDEG